MTTAAAPISTHLYRVIGTDWNGKRRVVEVTTYNAGQAVHHASPTLDLRHGYTVARVVRGGTVTELVVLGCYCPSDCLCRRPWTQRVSPCGCQQH